jgi:lambda family phage portal protein
MFDVVKRKIRQLRRSWDGEAGRYGGGRMDAAGNSGRWPREAMTPSLPIESLASRRMVSWRAQYQIMNAPVVESIANVLCTNLIGDGPAIRSGHPNKNMASVLEQSWNDWQMHADIEGNGGDLVSILNRVVRGFVTHGEAFVRFVPVRRGELRLQLISPEMVDPALNRFDIDGTGKRIVAGIELGPQGERLGYWVRPQLETSFVSVYQPAVRVPASEICHVYEPRFPGQIRGISWIAPCMTRIQELDSLEDAALAKARTTALFAGFVRDLEGTGFPDTERGNPNDLSLEPGTMRVLPPGTDITFAPTSDMSGLAGFMKHILRSIAAGSGTPYNLIADDLEGVNYSSARVGLQNFWRRCGAIRSSILAARFLQLVWERWVTLEILSGRLHAPGFENHSDQFFAATFLWPQPTSLDPLKDAEADVVALDAGLRSRQEIIAARGRDPSEVTAELEADTFVPKAPTIKEPSPLLTQGAP